MQRSDDRQPTLAPDGLERVLRAICIDCCRDGGCREHYSPEQCTCWVRLQSDEDRFGIRYGAHNPECPVFRPSRDPVDNLHDAELRAQHEVGTRPPQGGK